MSIMTPTVSTLGNLLCPQNLSFHGGSAFFDAQAALDFVFHRHVALDAYFEARNMRISVHAHITEAKLKKAIIFALRTHPPGILAPLTSAKRVLSRP